MSRRDVLYYCSVEDAAKNIKDKTIKAAEEIEDQNTLVIEFTDGTVLYLNIGAEGCHIGEKWEE